MYIGLLVVQRIGLDDTQVVVQDVSKLYAITHLDLSPQDNMCVPSICQAKNAAKLVHCQLADITYLKFWRLAWVHARSG